MEAANKSKKSIGKIISGFSMPILLVLLIVIFSIWSPKFFSVYNLTNILVQNIHIAVCCSGIFMIMVSGGCDLSIGYQMSVAAVLIGKFVGEGILPVWAAVILGIVLCALLGTFNGIMATMLNSHTMIVTLATMAIFHGISFIISNSKSFLISDTSYLIFGQGQIGPVPVSLIIAVVVIVIVGIVMSLTSVGRKVYAVGDNPEAARLAGLNVTKIKILVFTFAGVLVGISAILLSSRGGFAKADMGCGIEFTGIIACVLSGVALKGGEGTLWKAIVAVFVLGVLGNGMQLVGLGANPQYIAQGIIMLASLYLSNRTVAVKR